MPYLTRSISKDPTIASRRVTWDRRASSLALVSEEGVGLERLERRWGITVSLREQVEREKLEQERRVASIDLNLLLGNHSKAITPQAR